MEDFLMRTISEESADGKIRVSRSRHSNGYSSITIRVGTATGAAMMTPQDTPLTRYAVAAIALRNLGPVRSFEELRNVTEQLERSLAAAQARVQALSVGVGNIIWMTGGETSREQLQNIRNYATNLLDPTKVAPQEGER